MRITNCSDPSCFPFQSSMREKSQLFRCYNTRNFLARGVKMSAPLSRSLSYHVWASLQRPKVAHKGEDRHLASVDPPSQHLVVARSSIKWPHLPPIHTAHQTRTSSSPNNSCLKQTKKVSSNKHFHTHTSFYNQKCDSNSSSSSLSLLPSSQLPFPTLTLKPHQLNGKQTQGARTSTILVACKVTFSHKAHANVAGFIAVLCNISFSSFHLDITTSIVAATRRM